MLSKPEFLFELARRRIIERYVGSSVVLLWVVVAPLIPLFTNLAVFYFVARIPSVQSMGLAAYAVYIFSGLLPFRIMQSTVAEAGELLSGNIDILKSVNFPLAYLSMSAVAALMLEFAIQLGLMLVLLLISGTGIGMRIAMLPFALVLLVSLLLGISWVVSVAGYVLRELREVLAVIMTVLLYFSPVMYPLEAAPPAIRTVMLFNPISHFVVIFRDALLPQNEGIHWSSWLASTLLAILVFAAGRYTIHRTQRFVGDFI